MINESLVMENIKNSRVFRELCHQQKIDARHLEELVKHVDGITAILTRGKENKSLNNRQRDCVEEEFKQLENFVTSKMKDMFNKRLFASITWSRNALAKDALAAADQGK